ncbi:MAG TPA: YhbY family RNA-binding protein [Gammaproteobacteria bacterium]|nr:YhbY family RNA-binding protein [Gammaproteobacteria bacterium]
MEKKEKLALIAKAHHLKPVVMIGNKGLTNNVIAETDQSLNIHELIKVKVSVDDKTQRHEIMHELCSALNATPLNLMGNIAIIYRKKPE